MRIIMALLIFVCVQSTSAYALDTKWKYDITYTNDTTTPSLAVQASYNDAAGKVTKFYLPESSRVEGACHVHDFTVTSSHKINIVPQDCTVEVYHNNGDDINFRYNIASAETTDLIPYPLPFGALITSKYFYFVGSNIFLSVDSDNTNYSVIWHMPKNSSKIANFYGFSKEQKFSARPKDFLNNIYMGGQIDKTKLNSNQYLITTGFSKASQNDFAKFWKQQLKITKQMWIDKKHSPYIINMAALTQNNAPDNQTFGISSKESLGVFLYNPKNVLDDLEVRGTLTHESLHRWIGGYIDMPTEIWFMEGFTEFYARQIILEQSGDLKHYVHWHNKALRHYYTLPGNDYLHARNTANFTNLMAPYIFGYLLASDINYQIKQNSEMQYSLIDVMREMYDQSKISDAPIAIENLIHSGKIYWDKFGNYLNTKIEHKSLPSGNIGELGPSARLVYKKYRVAQYPLDHIAAMNSMIVDGIKSGSKLYNMGIRNGQRVIKSEILDEKSPDLPIRLTIETATGPQVVTIHRHGKLIEVPQYEIVE